MQSDVSRYPRDMTQGKPRQTSSRSASDRADVQAQQSIPGTFFPDLNARTKEEISLKPDELVRRIKRERAAEKHTLPLIKLATFGTKRSGKGSLRWNGNLIEVTGVEADYDGGVMSPEDARDKIAAARLEAIIYASPSYTKARPRFRVLAFFRRPRQPRDRAQMVSRLNGILEGVLSLESWTASQAFYCGRIKGAPFPIYRTTGRRIDEMAELDAGAIHPRGGGISVRREPLPAVDQSSQTYCRETAANRLVRSAQKVAKTERGENRNSAINEQAFIMGGLVACNLLATEDVAEALIEAAHENGYCSDYGEDEAERVILAGLEAGMNYPTPMVTVDDFDDAPEDPHVSSVNKEFAVVEIPNNVVIARFRNDEFDNLSKSAFELKLANQFVPAGKKRIRLSQYWLSHPERREYRAMVFNPAGGEAPGVLNLWRGWRVEPRHDPDGCQWFLRLAREIVCQEDEKSLSYLLGWLAHMVQSPAEKPGVALVLIGSKGVGKDSLLGYAGRMLRASNYRNATHPKHVVGNFNAHQAQCLLLHMQEGVFAGNRAEAEILKSLITAERTLIEPKGMEPFEVDSFLRLAITSNSLNAVPATADERRFAVFNCGPKWPASHYRYFYEERDNGGPAALLGYLQSIDLSGFNVRNAPDTQGLRDQKLASLRGVAAWWRDRLFRGELPERMSTGFGDDEDEDADDWASSTRFVPTDLLVEDCSDWFARQRFGGNAPGPETFAKELRELCPGSVRKRSSQGKRAWGYQFPPLEICVADFERHLGVTLGLNDHEG